MGDVTKGVDMEELNYHIDQLRQRTGESSVGPVMVEFDRMRTKLDQISEGKTVLIMSPEDRAKDVLELDDGTLAQWARWVVSNAREIHERKAEKDEANITSITVMHGVVSLALMALNMHAGEARFKVGGVTYKGEEKGDWELTIRKVEDEQSDRAVVEQFWRALQEAEPTAELVMPEEDWARTASFVRDLRSRFADEIKLPADAYERVAGVLDLHGLPTEGFREGKHYDLAEEIVDVLNTTMVEA